MEEKMFTVIETMADQLGVTAQHLWGVLIQQAPISASVDLVCFFVFVFGSIFCFKRLFRQSRDLALNTWDNGEVIFSGIVFGFGLFMCFVFVITFVANFSRMLAGFFNPEYWALMQILDKF